MRAFLLVLLMGYGSLVQAEWTGVSFEISDVDFDWQFDEGVRTAKSNTLLLSFEESTKTGLAVGAALGYLDARLQGTDTAPSFKFDAEHLKVYLRQDIPMGESVELRGLFSYGYFNGSESGSDTTTDVEWNETVLEFGVNFRTENLGFTPFASYVDVDGDISGEEIGRDRSFELEDPYIYGIEINTYTDPTAYVGLRLQVGSQSGGYLSFVRRY